MKVWLIPAERCGSTCRNTSPVGGSSLITSAPKSPRIWAASGPIPSDVMSMTRRPVSGPLSGACCDIVALIPAATVAGSSCPASRARCKLDDLFRGLRVGCVDVLALVHHRRAPFPGRSVKRLDHAAIVAQLLLGRREDGVHHSSIAGMQD